MILLLTELCLYAQDVILKPEEQGKASIRYLYEIAKCAARISGRTRVYAESAHGVKLSTSDQLNDDVDVLPRLYLWNQ